MLHQIGIGTLGPVFRTYEPTRDRLVAVKAFRLDIVPEQAQALAAGLSRASKASLFHPSIVEPIDAGVEGTVAYRAEEYVAAESLDVAMRHYAPAPIEKVLPFITQLSGAIDFARAAGIGHGGLHPRDIFVTPDEARATGFGVVDALEQVGIRAPIRRPYSAPERIDGRAWSTQADVFSLAVITFELLTGKRPSGYGADIGALPDSEHAAALQRVLARAMDEFPAERYPSALAFASALEAASQGRRLTDAVSVVDAIAATPLSIDPPPQPPVPETPVPSPDIVKPDVPKPAARSRKPPAAKPAPPPPAPEPPVIVPVPVVEAPIAASPAPGAPGAPGNVALDRVHAALDDVEDRTERAGAMREGSLFDDADAAGSGSAAPPRFAFLEDEKTGLEDEKTENLEDGKYEEAAGAMEDESPAEAAMFHARDPEPGPSYAADEGRPAILPYAVLGILMLLIGFAGGYFVRDRAAQSPLSQEPIEASNKNPAAPAATAAATPGSAATPASAATPERPGQYSEQRVAPPAARPPATVSTPPPAARPTAPPVAPAVTKGQIVVRSTPTNAGVTINGLWRGRTPLTIDNLAFGNYLIRVVQPGYLVARDEFTLNAREPARTFAPRLERTPAAAPPPATPAPATRPPSASGPAPAASAFTGSLYVDSRPRGAAVIIDGRSFGQTPVTVPEMRAGSHVVRIEMDGKKPVTANPRIVAGQTERVTVSLEDK